VGASGGTPSRPPVPSRRCTSRGGAHSWIPLRAGTRVRHGRPGAVGELEARCVRPRRRAGRLRRHEQDHPGRAGRTLATRGPINLPPSPPGQPVIVQAGGGNDGLEIAGRYGNATYANPLTIEDAQGYSRSVQDVMRSLGRDPQELVVLPLATGGIVAHTLVIDHALRPVLAAMGATEVVHGHFLLDAFVSLSEGRVVFTPEVRGPSARLSSASLAPWMTAKPPPDPNLRTRAIRRQADRSRAPAGRNAVGGCRPPARPGRRPGLRSPTLLRTSPQPRQLGRHTRDCSLTRRNQCRGIRKPQPASTGS
jgi:Luciferase-like monooxygenase